MSDGLVTTMRKMEVGTVSLIKRPTIKEVKIDTSKVKGFDAKKEMERIAEEAKASKEANPGGITVNVYSFRSTDLATKGMDVTEVLLQQIAKLIQEGNFAEALKKLADLLKKQPDHPEALYFKAVCILNTDGKPESVESEFEALQILQALTAKVKDPGLLHKINFIKTDVCAHLKKKFPILFLASLIAGPGKIDEMLAAISQIIEIDPLCADYYAFKTIVLMETRRAMEAYECVEQGIKKIGESGSSLLQNLRAKLLNQVLYLVMYPAIKLYKSREFDKARKELEKIDLRFKSEDEYQLFAAYLKKFNGGFLGFGKKRLGEVAMDGAPQDRWKLQEFIVREDIAMATMMLNNGDPGRAQMILENAFAFAPEYPYMSYLIAGCIFGQIARALLAGKLPDIDQSLEALDMSKIHIGIAAADHELAGVRKLAGEIDGIMGFFNSVKSEIKRQQEEAKKVNALISEFVEIMQIGKEGISSIEMFETIFKRMKALKSHVRSVGGQVTGEEGKKNLTMLDEVIDKNLSVLEKMKADIEEQKKDKDVIEEAWGKFNQHMGTIKGGISSESDLDRFQKGLSELQWKISGYKDRVRSQAAKDNLKQLEEAIAKNISDIGEMRSKIVGQLRDRKDVDECGAEFKSIAQTLSGGPFSSRSAASNFKDRVETARNNASSAKYRVSSSDAKNALDQMIAQYDTLLGQFRNAGIY